MKLITLIKIVPGKTSDGFAKLREIPNIELPAGVSSRLAWVTYGGYDLVWAWEAPDMKTANQVLREVAKEGLFTTETMAAQEANEF